MKAKLITSPFKSAIYFAIICFLLLPPKLFSQTTYQINGRTLLKQNNTFFDITQNDTVKVSTNEISVEFKLNSLTSGKSKMLSIPGVQLIKEWSTHECHYQISSNADFISTISSLVAMNEIEKVNFSYIFRMQAHLTQLTHGTQGNQNSTPNINWWPDDEQNTDMWELIRTNVFPGTPNPYPQDQDPLITAWSYTYGDPSLKVAVIDDGLVWNDADFGPDNLLGYDFLNNDQNVTPTPTIYYPNLGTATASIIAGRTGNQHGLYGVAGGYYSYGINADPVKLVVYRAMERVTEFGELAAYISLQAATSSIYDAIEKGVRVINLGFWLDVQPDPAQYPVVQDFNKALHKAYDQEILVFAPSGAVFDLNGEGHGPIAWPAILDEVIAVGGTDREDHPACYNHFDRLYPPSGEQNELMLPGDDIEIRDIFLSCPTIPGVFNTFSWPTIPCALASGISALVLSANPCLSRAEVVEILHKSCEKIVSPSFYDINGHSNNYGYGLLNAETAVELALGTNPTPITGNVTWNTDHYSGDIIIQPNSTLTLNNMTLKMMDQKGITVQVGGQLIVNNSTITTNCNTVTHRWKGITIKGTGQTATQTIAYQGFVRLNNAILENSEKAVEVKLSGGIIRATNTKFLNCDQAFNFMYYYHRSTSYFDRCTFEVNNLFFGNYSDANAMVNLEKITGISFNGCKFLNTKTTLPTGTALKVYAAGFSLNGICSNSQIYPCPPSLLEHGQITNFNYGIYSTIALYLSKTKIESTDFIGNYHGAYFTSITSFDFLNCSFQIPEHQPNFPDTYGLYLEFASGFHVEGNTFTSYLPNTTGQIGIYIRHCGSDQNYIYRNTFTNLSRATVSEGTNRSSSGATGICFKCNDFSTNGTDIDVILVPGTTTMPNSGIARFQGTFLDGYTTSLPDTLAAANSFTLSPVYNIRNLSGNMTNYIYHNFNDVPDYKIIPNPNLNITNNNNYQTHYNRTTICKPWINSGVSIQQQLAMKSAAKNNAELVGLQLQNLIDGGSTENLTFEVLGSTPPEALELRDQLLEESPYLSDTVLKTAINQENVLPNALLRDILVENPQASKSDEIMNQLDERWEPMPDYMKTEIEAGKEILGGREKLEALQATYLQQEGLYFNRIVSTYLDDTINPDAGVQLKSFLQNESTAQAGFLLADINLQQQDYIAASQAIQTMQSNLKLDDNQSQQATDYLTLLDILQALQADSIQPYNLDSLHALPLFALYQSGTNAANIITRDMLIASGLLDYQEPIDDAEISKSAEVKLISTNKPKVENRENLNLFPNPASSYTIAEYTLSNTENAVLQITQPNGVAVMQTNLTKAKDQVVLNLQNLAPGNYMVSLISKSKIIATKNLSIIH